MTPKGTAPVDVVTMLAVFEHIAPEDQALVVQACADVLVPGGLVVLTVPSPLVDPMLDVLIKARLIDGMAHEQHHGFVPADLQPLFAAGGFAEVAAERFQLGLNNLYVFGT